MDRQYIPWDRAMASIRETDGRRPTGERAGQTRGDIRTNILSRNRKRQGDRRWNPETDRREATSLIPRMVGIGNTASVSHRRSY